jgi:hypothetical protein
MKLQFSMRTLLFAVIPLCILLAVVANYARLARRQARAIEHLRAGGSRVEFYDSPDDVWEGNVPHQYAWHERQLVRWFGKEYISQVSFVHYFPKEMKTADLAQLGELRHLQILLIDNVEVVDNDALRQFENLQELKYMRMSADNLSSAGIANIAKCKQIVQLLFIASQVNDEAVDDLASLQHLKLLYLGTSISGEGIAQLKKDLPGCKVQLRTTQP